MSKQHKQDGTIALAYIGSVIPDTDEYRNTAFNRSGNMFQMNLLRALHKAGLSPSLILIQQPSQAFPRSRCLWHRGKHIELTPELSAWLLRYVNLPFIRPLTVGLGVVINLVKWAWRSRSATHRIVYTFNLTEPPGLFTWLGARLVGARSIASVMDLNVPGQTVPNSVSRRLDYWLHRQLLPRLNALVVVNTRIVEDFAQQATHIRLEGVVSEDLRKAIAKSPGPLSQYTQNDAFVIGYVGALDKANGIEEILSAFSLLSDSEYRLRIAGRGPLTHMVEAATAVDARIEYCGFIPFDKVVELYRTVDVLINIRITQRLHTDYFFPSKLIEYLATGVPVITTCTGHVEQEYREISYLLHEETPEAIAQKIAEVASEPRVARLEKGRRAQAHILLHNTWDVQGQRIAQFIMEQVYGG